jgi:hypothetical protein
MLYVISYIQFELLENVNPVIVEEWYRYSIT